MIWLQQASQAKATEPFDLSDRGLLLADGVFDTSLVTDGKIMLRKAHLDRLFRDAAALEIALNMKGLKRDLDRVLLDGPSGALRITVTRGPGGRGLYGDTQNEPTVIIRLTPYDTARMHAPVSIVVSDLTRNPGSISARHKTLAYTDSVMAVRRAVSRGAEEALMLNPEGNIACAASANMFARFGDALHTPPVSDGALPGVIRDFILTNAGKAGLKAQEGSLTVPDIKHADQIFLTNSLRLIAPVAQLEQQMFDTSPMTALNALLADQKPG
ncbi:MAG: aminotransferase class IV [Pseudomonadota bacterium]